MSGSIDEAFTSGSYVQSTALDSYVARDVVYSAVHNRYYIYNYDDSITYYAYWDGNTFTTGTSTTFSTGVEGIFDRNGTLELVDSDATTSASATHLRYTSVSNVVSGGTSTTGIITYRYLVCKWSVALGRYVMLYIYPVSSTYYTMSLDDATFASNTHTGALTTTACTDVDANATYVVATSLNNVYYVTSANVKTTVALTGDWKSIVYSPVVGKFVIVGTNRTGYSSNGTAWTANNTTGAWTRVIYVDTLSMFIACGTNIIGWSTDGISWSTMTTIVSNAWTRVVYDSARGTILLYANSGTNRIYSPLLPIYRIPSTIAPQSSTIDRSFDVYSSSTALDSYVAIGMIYSSVHNRYYFYSYASATTYYGYWSGNTFIIGTSNTFSTGVEGIFDRNGTLELVDSDATTATTAAHSRYTSVTNIVTGGALTSGAATYRFIVCKWSITLNRYVALYYNANNTTYYTISLNAAFTSSTHVGSLITTAFTDVDANATYVVATSLDNVYYVTSANVKTAVSLTGDWKSVVYSPAVDKFVIVGTNRTGYSANGVSWIASDTTGAWTHVIYVNALSMFVACGTNIIGWSADGISWSTMATPVSNAWTKIAYDVASSVLLLYSNSGTTRLICSSPIYVPYDADLSNKLTSGYTQSTALDSYVARGMVYSVVHNRYYFHNYDNSTTYYGYWNNGSLVSGTSTTYGTGVEGIFDRNGTLELIDSAATNAGSGDLHYRYTSVDNIISTGTSSGNTITLNRFTVCKWSDTLGRYVTIRNYLANYYTMSITADLNTREHNYAAGALPIIVDVDANATYLVAVGLNKIYYITSAGGGTPVTLAGDWKSVIYSSVVGKFVIVGSNCTGYSSDGVLWVTKDTYGAWTHVIYVAALSVFVASGHGVIGWSTDGIVWHGTSTAIYKPWTKLAYSTSANRALLYANNGTNRVYISRNILFSESTPTATINNAITTNYSTSIGVDGYSKTYLNYSTVTNCFYLYSSGTAVCAFWSNGKLITNYSSGTYGSDVRAVIDYMGKLAVVNNTTLAIGQNNTLTASSVDGTVAFSAAPYNGLVRHIVSVDTFVYMTSSTNLVRTAYSGGHTSTTLPTACTGFDIIDGYVVCVGTDAIYAVNTTSNEVTTVSVSGAFNAVVCGGSPLVASAVGNNVTAYSTDGINWTVSEASVDWKDVIYSTDMGMFTACATDSFGCSYDGATWYKTSTGVSNTWTQLEHDRSTKRFTLFSNGASPKMFFSDSLPATTAPALPITDPVIVSAIQTKYSTSTSLDSYTKAFMFYSTLMDYMYVYESGTAGYTYWVGGTASSGVSSGTYGTDIRAIFEYDNKLAVVNDATLAIGQSKTLNASSVTSTLALSAAPLFGKVRYVSSTGHFVYATTSTNLVRTTSVPAHLSTTLATKCTDMDIIGDQIVCVGTDVIYSVKASDGSITVNNVPGTFTCVAYNPYVNMIVAMGANVVAYSSDGLFWQRFSDTVSWTDVSYADYIKMFIACATDTFGYSVDGVNWFKITTTTSKSWIRTEYNAMLGKIVLYNSGSSPKLYYSGAIGVAPFVSPSLAMVYAVTSGYSIPTVANAYSNTHMYYSKLMNCVYFYSAGVANCVHWTGGKLWTHTSSGTQGSDIRAILEYNNQLVVVNGSTLAIGQNKLITNTGLTTISLYGEPLYGIVRYIASMNSFIYLTSSTTLVRTGAADGVHVATTLPTACVSLDAIGNKIVCVGTNYVYALNVSTEELTTIPLTGTFKSVVYSSDFKIIAAVGDLVTAYSYNGLTWYSRESLDSWLKVSYSSELRMLVACAANTVGYTTNGVGWARIETPEYNSWDNIVYNTELCKLMMYKNSGAQRLFITNTIASPLVGAGVEPVPTTAISNAIRSTYTTSTEVDTYAKTYMYYSKVMDCTYLYSSGVANYLFQSNGRMWSGTSRGAHGTNISAIIDYDSQLAVVQDTTLYIGQTKELNDGASSSVALSAAPYNSLLKFGATLTTPAFIYLTADNTLVRTKPDGTHIATSPSTFGTTVVDFETIGDKIACVGTDVIYTVDGTANTYSTISITGTFKSIACGLTTPVITAVGTNVVAYSYDGLNWVRSDDTKDWRHVIYSSDLSMFLACGVNTFGYSLDGINWAKITTITKTWNQVAYDSVIKCIILFSTTATKLLFSAPIVTPSPGFGVEPVASDAYTAALSTYATVLTSINGYSNLYMYYSMVKDCMYMFNASGFANYAYRSNGRVWIGTSTGTNCNDIRAVLDYDNQLAVVNNTTLYIGQNREINATGISNTIALSATPILGLVKYGSTLTAPAFMYLTAANTLVRTKPDGTHITTSPATFTTNVVDFESIGDVIACVGTDAIYVVDGTANTYTTVVIKGTFNSVARGLATPMLVAVGTNVTAYSVDGLQWTRGDDTKDWHNVIYSSDLGVFIACGINVIGYSSDGINWAKITTSVSNTWTRVEYDIMLNNIILYSNAGTKLYVSAPMDALEIDPTPTPDPDPTYEPVASSVYSNAITSAYTSSTVMDSISLPYMHYSEITKRFYFYFTTGTATYMYYTYDGRLETGTSSGTYGTDISAVLDYGGALAVVNGTTLAIGQNASLSASAVSTTVALSAAPYNGIIKYGSTLATPAFIYMTNSTTLVRTKLDGTHIQTIPSTFGSPVVDFVNFGDIIICIGTNIIYAVNCTDNTYTTINLPGTFSSIACRNSSPVIAIVGTNVTAHSVDGLKWTYSYDTKIWNKVAYRTDLGVFVACGDNVFGYSVDGINWAKVSTSVINTWNQIEYDTVKKRLMLFKNSGTRKLYLSSQIQELDPETAPATPADIADSYTSGYFTEDACDGYAKTYLMYSRVMDSMYLYSSGVANPAYWTGSTLTTLDSSGTYGSDISAVLEYDNKLAVVNGTTLAIGQTKDLNASAVDTTVLLSGAPLCGIVRYSSQASSFVYMTDPTTLVRTTLAGVHTTTTLPTACVGLDIIAGQAVCVGTNAIYSVNTTTNVVSTISITGTFRTVAYSSELHMIVALGVNVVAYSYDGILWRRRTDAVDWKHVIYSSDLNLFIACATNTFGGSVDGVNWFRIATPISNTWTQVAYDVILESFILFSTTATKLLFSGQVPIPYVTPKDVNGEVIKEVITTDIDTSEFLALNPGSTDPSSALVNSSLYNPSLINVTIGGVPVTASATSVGYIEGTNEGTAIASKAMVLDSTKSISGVNSISCSSISANGVNIDTGITGDNYVSSIDYFSGVTPGTATENSLVVTNADNSVSIDKMTPYSTGSTSFSIKGTPTVLNLSASDNMSMTVWNDCCWGNESNKGCIVGNGKVATVVFTGGSQVVTEYDTSINLTKVSYCPWNRKFIALADTGVYLSTNGSAFTVIASLSTESLTAIDTDEYSCVMVGTDKIIWTTDLDVFYTVPLTGVWKSVAIGDTTVAAVGTDVVAYASTSVLNTWTPMAKTGSWNGVAYGPSGFIAVSSAAVDVGKVLYSVDGSSWFSPAESWRTTFSSSAVMLNKIMWIPFYDMFIVTTANNGASSASIYMSNDGINWFPQRYESVSTIPCVCWCPTQLCLMGISDGLPKNNETGLGIFKPAICSTPVIVPEAGTLLTSSYIRIRSTDDTGVLHALGGEMFLYSNDGYSFKRCTEVGVAASVARVVNDVAYSSTLGLYVAVGSYTVDTFSNIITSTNGIDWTPRTSGVTTEIECVIWVSSFGKFIAATRNANVVSLLWSTDGVNWTVKAAELSLTTLTFMTYVDNLSTVVLTGGASGVAITDGVGDITVGSTITYPTNIIGSAYCFSKFFIMSGSTVYYTTNLTDFTNTTASLSNATSLVYSPDLNALIATQYTLGSSSSVAMYDGTSWVSNVQVTTNDYNSMGIYVFTSKTFSAWSTTYKRLYISTNNKNIAMSRSVKPRLLLSDQGVVPESTKCLPSMELVSKQTCDKVACAVVNRYFTSTAIDAVASINYMFYSKLMNYFYFVRGANTAAYIKIADGVISTVAYGNTTYGAGVFSIFEYNNQLAVLYTDGGIRIGQNKTLDVAATIGPPITVGDYPLNGRIIYIPVINSFMYISATILYRTTVDSTTTSTTPGGTLCGCDAIGNQFVVGRDGSIYSVNVLTNAVTTVSATGTNSSVVYGRELGVIIVVPSNANKSSYSYDGITWFTTASNNYWTSVIYVPEKQMFAGCRTNTFGYSLDGINWTEITTPVNNVWISIVYNSWLKNFVLCANAGTQRLFFTGPIDISPNVIAAPDNAYVEDDKLALFARSEYPPMTDLTHAVETTGTIRLSSAAGQSNMNMNSSGEMVATPTTIAIPVSDGVTKGLAFNGSILNVSDLSIRNALLTDPLYATKTTYGCLSVNDNKIMSVSNAYVSALSLQPADADSGLIVADSSGAIEIPKCVPDSIQIGATEIKRPKVVDGGLVTFTELSILGASQMDNVTYYNKSTYALAYSPDLNMLVYINNTKPNTVSYSYDNGATWSVASLVNLTFTITYSDEQYIQRKLIWLTRYKAFLFVDNTKVYISYNGISWTLLYTTTITGNKLHLSTDSTGAPVVTGVSGFATPTDANNLYGAWTYNTTANLKVFNPVWVPAFNGYVANYITTNTSIYYSTNMVTWNELVNNTGYTGAYKTFCVVSDGIYFAANGIIYKKTSTTLNSAGVTQMYNSEITSMCITLCPIPETNSVAAFISKRDQGTKSALIYNNGESVFTSVVSISTLDSTQNNFFGDNASFGTEVGMLWTGSSIIMIAQMRITKAYISTSFTGGVIQWTRNVKWLETMQRARSTGDRLSTFSDNEGIIIKKHDTTSYNLKALAYNGSTLLYVGTNVVATTTRSKYAPTFTTKTGNWIDCIWDGTLWVVLGDATIEYSADASVWTSYEFIGGKNIVKQGANYVVSTATGVKVSTDITSNTWTTIMLTGTWNAVRYLNGYWILVGVDAIAYSTDVSTQAAWTIVPCFGTWYDIAYGRNMYIACGEHAVFRTYDITKTKFIVKRMFRTYNSILYSRYFGRFYTSSSELHTQLSISMIMSSVDGYTWVSNYKLNDGLLGVSGVFKQLSIARLYWLDNTTQFVMPATSTTDNIYLLTTDYIEANDENTLITTPLTINANAGKINIANSTLTTGSYYLNVHIDSAAKPATSTWTISSDNRLKEDIVDADLRQCYDLVKNLPLKYFKWKDTFAADTSTTDMHRLGWIAQDVEQVIPKAVDISEKLGLTDCRSLNSSQIVANLYGAVQYLLKSIQDKEEALKNRTSL